MRLLSLDNSEQQCIFLRRKKTACLFFHGSSGFSLFVQILSYVRMEVGRKRDRKAYIQGNRNLVRGVLAPKKKCQAWAALCYTQRIIFILGTNIPLSLLKILFFSFLLLKFLTSLTKKVVGMFFRPISLPTLNVIWKLCVLWYFLI